MAVSILSWNINKLKFDDVKSYLFEVFKVEKDISILTFLESENLNDAEIENLGYSKIKLTETEPSKKTIKVFSKNGIDYEINNLYHYNNEFITEIKKTTMSSNLKSYILHEASILKRTERISSLEAFSVTNKTTSESFLYIAIHIPSQLYKDENDQFQTAISYKKYITERAVKYDNKIVVSGDFNMAPFDKGMTEPMGFFAFQNNEEAREKEESILASKQLSFYNPTWSLLGDYSQKTNKHRVGGSFYYEKTSNRKLKTWHLIDQVIISKRIFDKFDHSALKIIETSSLVNDAKLNTKDIDHLPLYYSIKI